MFVKTLIQTSLALAMLSGAAAAAETYKKVGSEAGWDVYVREGKMRGCLISKDLNQDAQVQMGINPAEQVPGFMALYTKAGAQVSSGEKISVTFDVDGQKFTGEAVAQEMEGYKGAYVQVNNPQFIYDLAKKNKLTITPAGRPPIVLSLKGTDAAFNALKICQQATQ